ncbi:MAG: lipopolysaccharide biosynthesis protein [Muribaculaceae bacterium]|nr:lipopolysaccharide biosynthesis protein [Muribaculaceae bacterium]
MEDNPRPLKERTEQSLFWSMLNNGTLQVLNLLFGIVLARLLTPGDYGIVGVLTIFSLIAGNLQSSGFTQALINLKPPKDKDYNSVFWFNVIASVILYAILWFCAPLIASFFHQPVLVGVSRFVFLAFLISSLGIAHGGYMLKNMMNREIAIINLIALMCSGGTGIVLAFNGYAYWSLAWQQVIYITVLNLGRYYYVKWHPTWHIDFGPVKRMFAFAVNILFTNIINTLNGQILTFIFGRFFPISQVGNYSQANKWNTQANTFVSGTMGQVVQTVLVNVNDDKERQKRVFRKMIRFTAFISFPVMLGLALVAKEFIEVMLGDKWTECIPLLQILCIAGAFIPLYTVYQHLAIGCKRSDLYLWCNVGQIVFQIGLILLCYYLFSKSIIVIVTVYSVFSILWLATWQVVAKHLTGLKWIEAILDIVPFMVITVAVFAIAYFSTLWIDNNVLLLIAKVIIGAALYIAVMKLAKVKIFAECWDFMRQKLKRKHSSQ